MEKRLYSLNDIMTPKEAAIRWGKSTGTIQHLCNGIKGVSLPVFTSDECRKSGNVFLITKGAMERLYGRELSELVTYEQVVKKVKERHGDEPYIDTWKRVMSKYRESGRLPKAAKNWKCPF